MSKIMSNLLMISSSKMRALAEAHGGFFIIGDDEFLCGIDI
jgi:hypothetical protein